MFSTAWFRLTVCACLLSTFAVSARAQSGGVTLYRVFLADGSTVVSYGEFARVGDQVVISLPLGGTEAEPELQLLSLPASAVDWDKTDAYAESARAARYAATRGPDDFALLNSAVSIALNDIAATADPQRKIAMAGEARQNVTKWAAEHFGYRAKEVAGLAGLFDDVIAQTQSAEGMTNVGLSLVANLAVPPSVPLMAPPSLQERVEEAFAAVALAPEPAARSSLLRSIEKTLSSVDRHAAWAVPIRAKVGAALASEARTDRAYSTLVRGTLRLADRYARSANVTAIERLVHRVLRQDDRLGRRRPNEMASALAALDAHLDAARRLRLARDSYAARTAVLHAYQRAVTQPVAAMRASRAALGQIQHLAGPSHARLTALAARTAAAVKRLAAATVPAEAAAAHDLLRNALNLAARAADGRLKAIASGKMAQAWEASSAAAGALMLFDQAVDALHHLSANLPRPRKTS